MLRSLLCLSLLILAAPTRAGDPQPTKKGDFFGLAKLHTLNLTIEAANWEKMKPTKQPSFMIPGGPKPRPEEKPKEDNPERKPHGGFGYDFEWVKAELGIDGQTLKDVAVRYKGNSTYMMSQALLKKPFRIDFNRYIEGQQFQAVKHLALGSLVVDASGLREALAFQVYRAAGVPAPRTAYGQVSLTIPGKYKGELLGLYVLIEAIDRPFLKEHFGSAKGLLLKPERVGPLEYLGEDWKRYEERYQPKTDATPKQQRRLIELTRLIARGSDEQFRKEIGSYIDVDQFTRYLAATVLLGSLDSFIGLGHNYYLYLNPKTNRFVLLPWDCDHSFGGMAMMGRPGTLEDLSIAQPATGSKKFVERLFSDEKVFALYKGHLDRLLKETFTVDHFRRDVAAIKAVIEPIQQKEKKAMAARKEGQFGKGMFNMAPPMIGIVEFVEKRRESVLAQLDGTSKGTVMASGFPFGGPKGGGPGKFGPGMFLVKPMLEAADQDKNGKLTKKEAVAGAKALFRACDTDSKGALDQKELTRALEVLLPKPQFGGGKPPPGGGFRPKGPEGLVAQALIEKAGKDGKLTEANLLAAVEKLFTEADKDRSGTVDERELGDAWQRFLPPPRLFGAPFGPPGDPPPAADPKKRPEAGK